MNNTAIRIIVFLLMIAGILVLQWFLSSRENKWPGLVLPILAFLYSLLYPLNMVAPDNGATFSFIFQLLLVWLVGNIPTFVLLAIYFACREKFKKRRQLDKMNIQDLN